VTLIPQAESSSVRNGHLKTVVPVVPDAPIGHFRLRLLGGKRGYIINTRDLCARRAVSEVVFNGQNGKRRKQRVVAKTRCGHTARRNKHRR
jgi:hypothetical protein